MIDIFSGAKTGTEPRKKIFASGISNLRFDFSFDEHIVRNQGFIFGSGTIFQYLISILSLIP
jgi:hypothetical protein